MPRFYLHLADGYCVCDEEGMMLPNVEAAREEALKSARDVMSDQVKQGFLTLRDRIEIVGEDGEPAATVAFRDAIRIDE
jgi:hypothetical protein